jgi:hypothetical protein
MAFFSTLFQPAGRRVETRRQPGLAAPPLLLAGLAWAVYNWLRPEANT